jgi:hypothetical protein
MVIVRTFGDAIVSQELNKEAWKKLSREFKWNEELLRKYRSEIDWEVLSENTEMLWTASILENFKSYINWIELSGNAPEKLLTPKIIERFADKWDWHELSDNGNLKLSYAMLDKFADKWDWERIINRWRSEELYTPDFLERYKEFIPVEEFKSSYLWDALAERRFDELVEEIMG